GGVANILAIDARTGATLRTLPDGSPTSDRSTLLATEEAKGATQTVVRRLEIGSGRELGSFTLDGTYHAIWTDGGQTALSRDGLHLALSIYPYQQSGEWVTGLRVVDVGSEAIEATLDLKAQSTYSFVAMSPDGRSLYLNQFGEGATGLRVFDVPSSTLLPATAIAGARSSRRGRRASYAGASHVVDNGEPRGSRRACGGRSPLLPGRGCEALHLRRRAALADRRSDLRGRVQGDRGREHRGPVVARR